MILIIGGNGFVGSAFVRWCRDAHVEHVVVTRENYQDYVGSTCSVLVNANGNSRKTLAQRDPVADFDASARSVAATLVDFRPDRYIFLSSCDVYPDCSSPNQTREDDVIDIRRQSTYGFHKLLAELCVQRSSAEYLVARLGGMVGPGLWKNAVHDVLRGDRLWLDPQSRIQFMSTDDVARIVMALSEVMPNRVVNVCGRGTISLSEVMDLTGRHIEPQPGSPKVVYDVNIARASAVLEIPDTHRAVREFVESEVLRS